MPGEVTTLVATPTRLGTYNMICNMLCGIGHSQMRTVVNVVTQAQFDAWIHRQLNPPKPPPSSGPVDAKALFATELRLVSHAVRPRGPPGTIGPTWTTSPPTPPSTATARRPRTT